jgi:nickel-dependent lactate racemase
VEIWIPYGGTEVRVGVPTENLVGLAEPKATGTLNNLRYEISQAISDPIGVAPLSQLVSRNDQVALVVDLPPSSVSFQVVDSLILELCNLVESQSLTVFWTHAQDWLQAEEGTDCGITRGFKVADLTSPSIQTVPINGSLGAKEIKINKELADAAIKILIGRTGFDPIWGYTGGATALLNVIDDDTRAQLYRQAVKSYLEKGSDQTNEENRMKSLVSSLDPCLTLNIVTTTSGDVIKLFAGSFEESSVASTKFFDDLYRIGFDKSPNVLIVGAGGRPYDQTLSAALNSALLNRDALKKGGAMILVAECMGGYGDKTFLQWMSKGEEAKQIKSSLKKGFEIGAEKAYFLTELLEEFRVYLVSVMPDYYARKIFKLKTSRTVDDALQSSLRIMGKDSGIAVVPYGTLTRTCIRAGA